ncbi:MAG: hypothetical protein ACUVT7_08375 [Thermoplasmata archaeon]
MAFVRGRDGKPEVLDGVVRPVNGKGVEFKYHYLDRAFFAAEVMRYIRARNIRFLVPAMVRGKRRNHPRTRQRQDELHDAVHNEEREDEGDHHISHPCRRDILEGEAEQARGYQVPVASSTFHPPLDPMLEEHRLQFGIESSNRLLSSSRIRTSTRDPKLRILYVFTSLLLVNTWVEKKWERLSTTRRGPGGRDVHAKLLPYSFLAMLQYVFKRKYEFILDVQVPEKRLHAGSMGS